MKTLNDYFDKFYCINLDRRTDRWAQCLSEFKKIGIKPERFSAIDGRLLPKDDQVSPGNIGATASHRSVLCDAKENNFDSVLIMEDDVEFHNNFSELFDSYIKEVPDDWDLLYFGGNHSLNNIWMSDPPKKVTDHVYRITKCYAIHCYGVKRTSYEKLITALHGRGKPGDVLISDVQPELNCYILRPHLAWQRASYSDIEGGHTDYSFLRN